LTASSFSVNFLAFLHLASLFQFGISTQSLHFCPHCCISVNICKSVNNSMINEQINILNFGNSL
jgi:hypothetical protein